MAKPQPQVRYPRTLNPRTLTPIVTDQKCELGDEFSCDYTATYRLDAPPYADTWLCCDGHAADEVVYLGAEVQR